MNKFPASVSEKIGYYVYTLADPRTKRVFYIGKGKANRVFQHARGRLRGNKPSAKLETIRRIRRQGKEVVYEIVRHGLNDETAYEVESALIDCAGRGRDDLTNKVEGHGADDRGRMSIADLLARYAARQIKIREPVVLIIVNKLYRRNLSPAQVYDITRGKWAMGDRRLGAKYALCVYRGIVREVYSIRSWRRVKARSKTQKRRQRWQFTGDVAADKQHYVGRSVTGYLKRGAQLPFRYINC